jgi:hypothetical protein
MSRFACPSEVRLQTMRVRPTGFDCSADASERSFGTLPPAAGFTEVSGRGLGQYDVRSTCATATAADKSNADAASAATYAIRSTKPRIKPIPSAGTPGPAV